MKLISTRSSEKTMTNILMTGDSGAGKTWQIRTLPKPLIVSAESGLLSLRDVDLPAVEINSIADLREVYQFFLKSADAKNYESVAIDSITEIAEILLAEEKAKTKDPRQAYGELAVQMAALLRAFRDLPNHHVYCSAKMVREKDEASGAFLYVPSMPGAKLGPLLPYMFDEVLVLRVQRNDEGQIERFIQTQRDGTYDAKDRSGALDMYEPPNVGDLIKKIQAPATTQKAA